MDKFTLSDGQLSQYAFACGYVQTKTIDKYRVELYKAGCYHIRVYEQIGENFLDTKRIIWEAYDSIGVARKVFNSYITQYKLLSHG